MNKKFIILIFFVIKICLSNNSLCDNFLNENFENFIPKIKIINSIKYIISIEPALYDLNNKNYFLMETFCEKGKGKIIYILKQDNNLAKNFDLNKCSEKLFDYPFLEDDSIYEKKIIRNFKNNNYLEIYTKNSDKFLSEINKLNEKNSDIDIKKNLECVNIIINYNKKMKIEFKNERFIFFSFQQVILYNFKYEKLLNFDQKMKTIKTESDFNNFYDKIINQLLKLQKLNICVTKKFEKELIFLNNKIIPFSIINTYIFYFCITPNDVFFNIFGSIFMNSPLNKNNFKKVFSYFYLNYKNNKIIKITEFYEFRNLLWENMIIKNKVENLDAKNELIAFINKYEFIKDVEIEFTDEENQNDIFEFSVKEQKKENFEIKNTISESELNYEADLINKLFISNNSLLLMRNLLFFILFLLI